MLSWPASSVRSSTCSEEGPRNDWFGDDTVAAACALDLGSLGGRVLRARAHGAATRSSTSARSPTAISALGSAVLVRARASGSTASPISIRSISAQMRGYDALMIGETMFVSGVAMFLTAPIAGRLMRRRRPARAC